MRAHLDCLRGRLSRSLTLRFVQDLEVMFVARSSPDILYWWTIDRDGQYSFLFGHSFYYLASCIRFFTRMYDPSCVLGLGTDEAPDCRAEKKGTVDREKLSPLNKLGFLSLFFFLSLLVFTTGIYTITCRPVFFVTWRRESIKPFKWFNLCWHPDEKNDSTTFRSYYLIP